MNASPNEEPPTMTGTRPNAPQLEASHQEIAENIVATVNQTTMTEAVEDPPVFRQRLQKMLGVKIIAAANKKDRILRPLINFVKKRNWEAIKSAFGQNWFNVLNRLHVREDCLLIDARIIISTQLRQTILESIHLTHTHTHTHTQDRPQCWTYAKTCGSHSSIDQPSKWR